MAAAHNNYGHVLLSKEQYSQAVSNFEKSLSINPNSESSHYGLGLAKLAL